MQDVLAKYEAHKRPCFGPKWADERVESLKKLVNEGLSAELIARRLGGITRNAVIGKVHRLGLSLHHSIPAARRAQSANGARVKRVQLAKARKKLVALGRRRDIDGPHAGRSHEINQRAHARAIALADAPPPQAQMVKLLDLEPHHCRWPIGDARTADFGFCGCTKASVGSYCEHHAKMSRREFYVSPDAGVWGADMRKRFAAA